MHFTSPPEDVITGMLEMKSWCCKKQCKHLKSNRKRGKYWPNHMTWYAWTKPAKSEWLYVYRDKNNGAQWCYMSWPASWTTQGGPNDLRLAPQPYQLASPIGDIPQVLSSEIWTAKHETDYVLLAPPGITYTKASHTPRQYYTMYIPISSLNTPKTASKVTHAITQSCWH